MRARWILVAAAIGVGGCSLLFDGKDLKGASVARGDMSITGGGGNGGSGDNDLGGVAGGDLAGTVGGACTPLSTVKFTVTKPSVAGSGPYEVALADINQDGKLDIVSANYNSNNFSVLLGGGDGSFALAATAPFATCTTPQYLTVRDVDNDGLADVIITCWDSTTAAISVHLNQSTTATVKFAAAKPVTVPSMHLLYLAAGNFNADANADLAVVDNFMNKVSIYVGDGHGNFTATTSYAAGTGASNPVVGRLNNDAVDDLIVYNYDDNDMTMLLSAAAGGFTTTRLAYDPTPATMGGTLYFAGFPSLIDINHDGLVDIVATSGTTQTGEVYVFANSGSAAAPAFPITGATVPTGDLPTALGLADFNCDGTLDIAVSSNGCDPANTSGCTDGKLEPPALWLLPGHGTGYDAALTTAIPRGTESVLIADFNHDGYPDLVTGSNGTAVTVLINTP